MKIKVIAEITIKLILNSLLDGLPTHRNAEIFMRSLSDKEMNCPDQRHCPGLSRNRISVQSRFTPTL